MTTELPGEVPGSEAEQQPTMVAPATEPDARPVILQIRRPNLSRRSLLIAAVAIVAIGGGLIFGLTSGPGSITAHGTEMVCGNLLQGTTPSDYADITDGTQVVVTDPSGKVIGNGALTSAPPVSASAGGLTLTDYLYNFTVTVPGGEARYGISIGQNRGTVWFTPDQMAKGPGVSLGC